MSKARLLKRQEEIVQILTRHESVTIRTLAETLGVSGWTVRRDLNRLAKTGSIQRQHGSVSLAMGQPLPPFGSFEKRSGESLAAKQMIGRATAQLIKSNQYVAMGAGTTTTQVARELARRKDKQLHIVTNALNIAMELAQCPNFQVICTGGDVRRDHYTLTGPVTDRALRAHFYDVAVIGVSGITMAEGLTVNSQLDAIALEIMIEQSRQLIVVADASKVGQVQFVHLAPLNKVDILVMDRSISPSFRKKLTQKGIDLLIANFNANDR